MKMEENDLGLELQQTLNEFYCCLRMCCFLKGFYLFCVRTCLRGNVLSYFG